MSHEGRPGGDLTRVDRLARISRAVARRWPLNALCLQRSLALLWLLRRNGISAELRIGVQKPEGKLLAHAWVEVEGKPVNDSPPFLDHFLVLQDASEPVPVLREAELIS